MKKIIILLTLIFIPILSLKTIFACPVYTADFTTPWKLYSNTYNLNDEEIIPSGYYLFAVEKEESIKLEEFGFYYLEYDENSILPFSSYDVDNISLYFLKHDIAAIPGVINTIDYISSISLIKSYSFIRNAFVYCGIDKFIYNLHKPYFINVDNELYVNISDSVPLNIIIQSFLVEDVFDGVLANSTLEILHDEYSSNYKKEGTYNVTVAATNSLNLTREINFKITVINDYTPNLLGPNEITISTSFTMNMDTIKSFITCTNYKGDNLEYKISLDTYKLSKTPGQYNLEFYTSDEFGEDTINIQINVITSFVAFYTTDNSNILIENYFDITDKELIEILSVIKEIQLNNVSLSYDIKETVGYNYVFYEYYISELKIEDRLTIHFLNNTIKQEIIEDNEFNLDIDYILIGVIILSILCLTGYFTYSYIKKKEY